MCNITYSRAILIMYLLFTVAFHESQLDFVDILLRQLLVFLQTEDEDMIYMYNAYLHKLITCFLSYPLAREKVN